MPVPGLIVRTRMVADVQPFGDDAGKYRLLRRSRIAGIVNNAEHDASDHDRKDDEKIIGNADVMAPKEEPPNEGPPNEGSPNEVPPNEGPKSIDVPAFPFFMNRAQH